MKKAIMVLAFTFGGAFPALAEDHPVDFNAVQVQSASVEDMAQFQPFIGTFQGKTYEGQNGTKFYFTVKYEYYNRDNTVVKFTLTTHLPDSGEERPLGEGYYYFDRMDGVIRVMGVFKDGRIGAGYMTPFDAEAGTREVRIAAKTPNGQTNQVRDTFKILDENSWLNITYIANDKGEWQAVSEDIYSRVPWDKPEV